jgi:hypothetical protein
MIKHTAVYVRVSSDRQLHRSQLADLKVWKEAHDTPTREYRDKVTGKTMDRPGWSKLWADVDIQTDTATTANVANRRMTHLPIVGQVGYQYAHQRTTSPAGSNSIRGRSAGPRPSRWRWEIRSE